MIKNLIRPLVLLFLCLFYVIGLKSQSLDQLPTLNPSYYENFDHLKSYPSMCFSHAFQDEAGKLWLTTCSSARQTGLILFQFDGYEFSITKQNLDSLGISADFKSLYQKNKLIALNGDSEKNDFLIYDLSSKKLESIDLEIKGKTIAFFTDESDQIYFLSQHNFQFYIHVWKDNKLDLVQQFKFAKADSIAQNKQETAIFISEFNKDAFWTHTNDFKQLLRFDIKSGEVQSYDDDDFDSRYGTPFFIAEKPLSGNIKVNKKGTYFSNRQNIWKLEGDKFIPCFDIPKEWSGKDIFVDQQGNILYLFAENNSIFFSILEDSLGRKYNYSAFFENLKSSYVRNIISDNFKEQITICSNEGIALAKVEASDAIQTTLANYSIRRMVELPEQKVLITTQNNKLFVYDLNSGSVSPFQNQDCYFNHNVLITDEAGTIWAANKDGIIKYQSESNDCEIIRNVPDQISIFTFVDEEQIVMNNDRKTINIYNLKTGITTQLREDQQDFLIQGFPHDMHYSKDGWLWLATSNGLYKIDVEQGVYDILGFEKPFPAPRFLSIHEDEKERLWLGTPLSGINILDPKTGELEIIDSEKGLANNTVVSILPDDDGDYWIGTYNGISIVSPEGNLIANVFKEDGLAHRENNRYAYLKTKSGKILIGTISGLNIIDPKPLKERLSKKQNIQVYLTALEYTNSEQNQNDVLTDYNLSPDKTIVLPASNRFMKLKVACSNYFSPEENQYAYKFEGIDEDWNYVGNQHIMNFNNLPAGRYKILVIAGDEIGNWSSKPLVLSIHAKTIFYKQIWFYILCIGLIIGGALLWINRLRLEVKKATKEIQEDKEIIEQQAIREKARAEKMQEQAQQIEIQAQRLSHSLDELQKKNEEILRTQNQLVQQEKLASLGQLTAGIAHEIKNPLNFINNFAEGSVELLQELIESANRNKENLPVEELNEMKLLIEDVLQNSIDIKNNGTRLDRIVHSMMDHARGSESKVQSVDLNALIDSNINLAHHGYRAMEPGFNVHIEKDFSDAISSVNVFPQELGRVLLNLLNNAFYILNEKQEEQKNNYRPHVEVKTFVEQDDDQNKYACIMIRDNGKGIPKLIKEKIFDPFFTTKPSGHGNTGLGLSIAYDIITKQHKGQLLVDSEVEQYTEFIIKLPL